MEQTPLSNSGIPVHGAPTITSEMEQTPLSNSGIPVHGSIKITSGVK
jgi:hypothetical protein